MERNEKIEGEVASWLSGAWTPLQRRSAVFASSLRMPVLPRPTSPYQKCFFFEITCQKFQSKRSFLDIHYLAESPEQLQQQNFA